MPSLFRTLAPRLRPLGLLALALLLPLLARAATYHVAAIGDYSADGLSPAAAWRTLAKVNASSFAPGDTILLRRGDTWREVLRPPSSGLAGQPITFSAYGDPALPKPHLTGAEIITGLALVPGTPSTYRVALATEPFIVTLDEDYFKRVGSLAALQDRQYFYDATAAVLYLRDDRGDPHAAGRLVQAAARNHAVTTDHDVDPKYIVIDELLLTRANSALVRIDGGARDWTVSDCDFWFANTANNIDGAGVHLSSASDCVLTRNFMRYMLGDAILVYGGSKNVETSHNDIALVFRGVNTGGDGIQYSSSTVGGTDGFRILHNRVSMQFTDTPKGCIIQERSNDGVIAGNHCAYGDFGVEFNGSRVVVENNTILHTAVESGQVSRGGIFTSDDHDFSDVVIRNNLVAHCAHKGIFITQTANPSDVRSRTNIRIYNNTIFECGDGIVTNQTGGEIRNNLVWSRSQTEGLVRVGAVPAGHTMTLSHNFYGPAGANEKFGFGGVTYTSLAAFQSATGQETSSRVGYPEFTDIVGGDFRLRPGSPALDAALSLAAVTHDLAGNPRPSGPAPDIGAYEGAFAGPVPSPARLLYEGFNYSAGSTALDGLDGGAGWGGPWRSTGANSGVTVLSSSLAAPGVSATGGALRLPPPGRRLERPLDRALGRDTGTLWLGLLARKNSSNRDTALSFDGLGVRQSGSSDWLLTTPGGGTANIPGAAVSATHFFVIRVDFTETRNFAYLWLNPDPALGEPSIGAAAVSRPFAATELRSLAVASGSNGSSNESADYDEIRLGHAFADIIAGTGSDFPPNTAPTAAARANSAAALVGQTIAFDALLSTDPDNALAAYSWDFGDGSSAAGATVSHAYAAHGTYTVTLRVEDALGAADTDTLSLYVNAPPLAAATSDRGSAAVGQTVRFDASASSDPNGSLVAHAWSFSDGSSATGAVVEKSFAEPGVVTATVTVTDNDGATAAFSLDLVVLVPPSVAHPLIAYEGFDYSAGLPLAGLDGGLGWGGPWTAGTASTYLVTVNTGNTAPGLATTGDVRARVRGHLSRPLAKPVDFQTGELWATVFLRCSNYTRNGQFKLREAGADVLSVRHSPESNLTVSGIGDLGVLSGAAARLVLLRIDFDLAGNRVTAWVDPDLVLGRPADSAANGSATFATNFGIDEIRLEHSSTSSHESNFDEIRLATTFEEAVGGVLGAAPLFTITSASHPPLAVSGPARLSGDLALAFNGHTPSAGDTYALVSATAADGVFGSVTLPAPPAGLYYLLQYEPAGLALKVLPSFDWPTYRKSVFGVSDQADPAFSGPDADPDLDGAPNGLEFVFGTELLAASSRPAAPGVELVATAGGLAPALRHPLRPGASFSPVIERGSDLRSWSPAAVITTGPDAHGEVLHVPQTASPGPRDFLRLRLDF